VEREQNQKALSVGPIELILVVMWPRLETSKSLPLWRSLASLKGFEE
jgi:hypothetical protein